MRTSPQSHNDKWFSVFRRSGIEILILPMYIPGRQGLLCITTIMMWTKHTLSPQGWLLGFLRSLLAKP